MPKYKISSKVKLSRKKVIVLLVLAVIAVVAVLELTDTTFLLHKREAKSGTIPSTVQTSAENEEPDSEPQDKPDESNKPDTQTSRSEKQIVAPRSGAELLAPSGSFVSNHQPSLKSSPQQESVCITTPGAKCKITFTKNGIVKTLEEKTSDSTGTVIWSWDINKAGFVEGSWQITAISSLDGQSKSTNDLQNMEVKP